ncbi:SDR family NAD(P)-dependent oxidoreductase [Nocardia veterana]|uniref:type I polyketide synthase n=1 Tax=Nocardia veterana TaxID=132249 RepID=UPI00289D5813|nr:SDR family NAD(P)-dependent oxidoreductase [Nocardia veterana]
MSGPVEAIVELERWWGERTRVRRLGVSHAFHSPMMEPMLAEFGSEVAGMSLSAARIPIASNVTGRLETDLFADPAYWVRHVRETVRFADGIAAARASGVVRFIEIGPDAVLAPMISRTVTGETAVLATQRRGRDQRTELLRCLGAAYCHGAHVDWAKFYAGTGARTVDLPTYPFQRQRFWLSTAPTAGAADDSGVHQVDHPFLSAMVTVAGTGETVVTGRISVTSHPWLTDHVIFGSTLLPGAAFVEIAATAAELVGCAEIRELVTEVPLRLDRDVATHVQVVVGAPDTAGDRTIAVHARPEAGAGAEDWVRHAVGTLGSAAAEHGRTDTTQTWPPPEAVAVPVQDLYPTLAGAGFDYGAGFRTVRGVWRCGSELCVESGLPSGADGAGFGCHPAVVDGVFHGVLAGVDGPASDDAVGLPFVFRGVRVFRRGATAVRARLRISENGVEQLVARDETGRVVWAMAGLQVRPATAETLRAAGMDDGAGLYDIDWIPVSVRPEPEGPIWGLGDPDTLGGWGSGIVDRWFVDVAAVTRALAAATPAAVVLPCWGAVEPGVATGTRSTVTAVLTTVQEWMSRPGLHSVRLVVVTRRAVSSPHAGDPRLDRDGLTQAGVTGLVRSAHWEYPGRMMLIDVDTGVGPDGVRGAILDTREQELLVRASGVWAPRLVRVTTPEREPASAPPPDPDGAQAHPDRPARPWGGAPDDVVVVAGGGELGGLVVRHLVTECGVRRVVVASRSGGGAELAAEMAAVGAEIWCVACDLADAQDTRRLVDKVSEWGALTAVVYTAGVLDDGVVASLSPEQVARVLRSKVDGAWSLHEATRGLRLRGFVLFSSVAGTVGAPGQANYAAANAFLDALAQYRRAAGLPGLSIGWGLWDVAGGMAGGVRAADRARMSRGGLVGLSVAEGLRLWDRVVCVDRPRVVAARFDRAAPVSEPAGPGGLVPSIMRGIVRPQGGAAAGADAAVSAALTARLAGLPVAERRRILIDLVSSHVGAVLGYATNQAVDIQASFLDLGFDSLAAVELRNRLTGATGIGLPATIAYDHPTPEAVAEFIATCLPLAEPGGDLDDALDRVAAVLAAAAPDTEARRRVARRLRGLLATVEATGEAEPDTDPDDDIRSADVAELFDLLDGELG